MASVPILSRAYLARASLKHESVGVVERDRFDLSRAYWARASLKRDVRPVRRRQVVAALPGLLGPGLIEARTAGRCGPRCWRTPLPGLLGPGLIEALKTGLVETY